MKTVERKKIKKLSFRQKVFLRVVRQDKAASNSGGKIKNPQP